MAATKALDKYDRLLLQALQENGRISNQELAEQANLSTAPCWRRLRKLEKEGIIHRYTALLNPAKIGLNATAYVHVSLVDHRSETLEEFDRFINTAYEVLECYSVSGNYDYLLRVVTADTAAFEEFLMKKLLQLRAVKSSNTDFVLRQKKYTTVLAVPD